MATVEKTDLFEECWRAYNRKGAKKVAKAQWDKLTDEEREAASVHIPHYVSSRDRIYCKDFERYLRDHVFENPVYDKKGEIVFDPEDPDREPEYVYIPGLQG